MFNNVIDRRHQIGRGGFVRFLGALSAARLSLMRTEDTRYTLCCGTESKPWSPDGEWAAFVLVVGFETPVHTGSTLAGVFTSSAISLNGLWKFDATATKTSFALASGKADGLAKYQKNKTI